ncbi:uncharacterized protein [Lepeophtheirus salmonis]|nr:uncharacterized protein LOC121128024 isoform X2 [Lepeophtheirus salmonis]
MMFIISENCHKLVYLDISYSVRVTGIGLLGLCGLSKSSGCRYLRDLILKHGNNCDTIVPKVIACLLRYLENLEVLDIHNLHEGIEYYYRGQGNGHYHPKPERIRPLNLIYYTGSEKLLEIVDVCPKLRTLKLTASEYLPSIGKMLVERNTILDHITLIWDEDTKYLIGLKGFLEACGSQIGSLEIDCPSTFMRAQDFLTIGRNCHLLENLAISHLKLETEDELTRQHEVEVLFPFLRSLKIQKIDHEPRVTKEVFKYLLINSPELEKIFFSFESPAYFFSDFFLDEILFLNPLGVLREFIVQNCSLTLISALKLVSSRPKLQLMGSVLNWDVEPRELDTFVQILRKAKGMNLLQDILIV